MTNIYDVLNYKEKSKTPTVKDSTNEEINITINKKSKELRNKKQNETNKIMKKYKEEIINKVTPILTEILEDYKKISKRYRNLKIKIKAKDGKYHLYDINLKSK